MSSFRTYHSRDKLLETWVDILWTKNSVSGVSRPPIKVSWKRPYTWHAGWQGISCFNVLMLGVDCNLDVCMGRGGGVWRWQKYVLLFRHWWKIKIKIDKKIALHYEFLEERILFGVQMNGEVFDILNYCILNGKFHENALDFYDYLICNGNSNHEQSTKFLSICDTL